MDATSPNSAALADLHLLLAHAFLPPLEASFVHSFAHDLPEDLGEVASELSFDCASTIAAFRESVLGLGKGELLQTYSALFLQPPQRASLDASVYLDGAAMGPTTLAVEERYLRYGLRPAERLRELPDHLSRLLEFSGFLLARVGGAEGEGQTAAFDAEARDFLGTYVRPWIPALSVEVRTACDELGLARPYQHLAELAAIAAWEGEGWRAEASKKRPAKAPRQAHCSQCNSPYAEDAALRAVRRIMKKKGLQIEHLDRCENCRGISDDVSGRVEPAQMRAI